MLKPKTRNPKYDEFYWMYIYNSFLNAPNIASSFFNFNGPSPITLKLCQCDKGSKCDDFQKSMFIYSRFISPCKGF